MSRGEKLRTWIYKTKSLPSLSEIFSVYIYMLVHSMTSLRFLLSIISHYRTIRSEPVSKHSSASSSAAWAHLNLDLATGSDPALHS